MFRNYIKIAFRNLMRHKAFSLLNISGLAIGMACSILILLWVQNELSFDKFHANADRTSAGTFCNKRPISHDNCSITDGGNVRKISQLADLKLIGGMA